jgi:hypothetical protein
MIFRSHDSIEKRECETEIRNAIVDDAVEFVQAWVSYYINKSLTNPDFQYDIFKWNKIIKASLTMGFGHKCFSAYTESRLDGLLSLSKDHTFHIDYIATAPWNCYPSGKMRRIGYGLIYHTIKTSQYVGLEGEFFLSALPRAEQFYEKIGMVRTGKVINTMNEYYLSKTKAVAFENGFKKYVIRL